MWLKGRFIWAHGFRGFSPSWRRHNSWGGSTCHGGGGGLEAGTPHIWADREAESWSRGGWGQGRTLKAHPWWPHLPDRSHFPEVPRPPHTAQLLENQCWKTARGAVLVTPLVSATKYLTKVEGGREGLFLLWCEDTVHGSRENMVRQAWRQAVTWQPPSGSRERGCWFSAPFLLWGP